MIEKRSRDNRWWRLYGCWIAGVLGFWRLAAVWIRLKLFPTKPSPDAELSRLTRAEGVDLIDLEWDKTSGLQGYRKSLVLSGTWTDMSLLVIGLLGYLLYSLAIDSINRGRNLIYEVENFSYTPLCWILVFILTTLWISHYFSRRIYPLLVPGEMN